MASQLEQMIVKLSEVLVQTTGEIERLENTLKWHMVASPPTAEPDSKAEVTGAMSPAAEFVMQLVRAARANAEHLASIHERLDVCAPGTRGPDGAGEVLGSAAFGVLEPERCLDLRAGGGQFVPPQEGVEFPRGPLVTPPPRMG